MTLFTKAAVLLPIVLASSALECLLAHVAITLQIRFANARLKQWLVALIVIPLVTANGLGAFLFIGLFIRGPVIRPVRGAAWHTFCAIVLLWCAGPIFWMYRWGWRKMKLADELTSQSRQERLPKHSTRADVHKPEKC